MPDIFIHLGLHKTGTTTLQLEFFPACKDLMFLIRSSCAEMEKFILKVTRNDPIYFQPEKARALLAPFIRDAIPNLLSNESFSGPTHAGFVDFGLDHRSPVLHNLSAVYPEAKAILVLRRQDNLARSWYRQYLKKGGTRKIDRFFGLKSIDKRAMMPLNRFYFSPYVDAVVKAFPSGVLIMAYEEFASDSGEFLRKLTEFIGIQTPDIILSKRNATRIGPKGMEFSRLLNYLFRSYHNPSGLLPGLPNVKKAKIKLESPMKVLHDQWPGNGKVDKSSFLYRTGQNILERFRNDNMVLDSKYQLGLKKFGYY